MIMISIEKSFFIVMRAQLRFSVILVIYESRKRISYIDNIENDIVSTHRNFIFILRMQLIKTKVSYIGY